MGEAAGERCTDIARDFARPDRQQLAPQTPVASPSTK